MRILHLIHSRNFAGSERSVITLSRDLIRRGHFVEVACRTGGTLRDHLREAAIPVADAELGLFGSAARITDYVRSNQFDIVHTHLTQAARIGLAVRRNTGCGLVTHLRIMRRDPVFAAILSEQGKLIANSPQTAAFYESPEGGSLSGIVTIPNASEIHRHPEAEIDRDAARQQILRQCDLPASHRYVLLAGRVSPGKGQDLAIEAWPLVLQQHPDLHLLIAGNLKQKPWYVRRLRHLRRALGLESRVHLVGFQRDLVPMVRGADAQLVPSRREPFGLVIIEAMLLGTPLVGANSGAIPGILEDGRLGTLFSERNGPALARSIEECLGNADATSEKTRRARETALSEYTPDTLADRVLTVYDEVRVPVNDDR